MSATGTSRGLTPNTNDVYNKICFDAFPFPNATEEQKKYIRTIASALDTHRKECQKRNPKLTLTHMYTVMRKIQDSIPLTPKESKICLQGDIPTLLKLHTELDEVVVEAYGWSKNISTDESLSRLVELNKIRAEEEKVGIIRWLHSNYQRQCDHVLSTNNYPQSITTTKQCSFLFNMNIEKSIIKEIPYKKWTCLIAGEKLQSSLYNMK